MVPVLRLQSERSGEELQVGLSLDLHRVGAEDLKETQKLFGVLHTLSETAHLKGRRQSRKRGRRRTGREATLETKAVNKIKQNANHKDNKEEEPQPKPLQPTCRLLHSFSLFFLFFLLLSLFSYRSFLSLYAALPLRFSSVSLSSSAIFLLLAFASNMPTMWKWRRGTSSVSSLSSIAYAHALSASQR